MDPWTENHLQRWLDVTIVEDDRVAVEAGIRRFVEDHPDLIENGRSWPEIRALAERRL